MAHVQSIRVGFAGTANLELRGKRVSPALANCLEETGYVISEDIDVDVLININHNWRSVSELEDSKKVRRTLKILIRLEPSSVYPSQYTNEVESLYDLILTPGSVGDPSQKDFLRWPYNYNLDPSSPSDFTPNPIDIFWENRKVGKYNFANWGQRSIECSLIAANKVSPNGSGNYGLRRSFAFEDLDGCLSVYGQLWDVSFFSRLRYRLAVLKFAIQSKSDYKIRHIFSDFSKKFKNARGQIQDKHEVIAQSKYSLVIENTNNYISEKLFDALVGGSIPIYFGPSLVNTGVPEDLVIRCNPSGANLVEIVRNTNENEAKRILAGIEGFLSGDEFPLWVSAAVNLEICTKIDEFVRSCA
jgi:hypothetical protein